MDKLVCPNCGTQIQITQALKQQLEEKIRTSEKVKYKEELEKVTAQIEAQTKKRLREELQEHEGNLAREGAEVECAREREPSGSQ